MKNNETPDLCGKCGGQCCLRMPGAVFPDQLKEVSVSILTEYFLAGYQFDYWEGDPRDNPKKPVFRAYFLRPQTVKSKGRVVDPSWGAACALLGSKGCSLEFDNRPRECQVLVATENYPACKSPIKGKKEAAIAWLPYTTIILETIAVLQG